MHDYTRIAAASEYPEPRLVNTGSSGGLGGVVTIANLLMAVVMAIALVRAQMSAIAVVITTGIYYASTTSLFLLITSGALTEIVRTRSDARTQRELHRLQFTVYRPPADSLPEPEPEAPKPLPAPVRTANFVSPYEATQSDWTEARLWLAQLFDLRTGQRDPKKVLGDDSADPGRICCKMPSRDAAKLLRQMQILRPTRGNGDKLNPRYPTRKEALAAFDSALVLPPSGRERGQGEGGG